MKSKGKLRKAITAGTLGTLLLSCSPDKSFTGPTQTEPNQPTQPTPQNTAPRITSSPVTGIDENLFYQYQLRAIDSDGDKLTYSLTEKPSWLSINSQTGLITGTAPEVPQDVSYGITAKVSDGKTSTDQNFNLTTKNVFDTYVVSTSGQNPLTGVSETSLVFLQPVDFKIGDVLVSNINSVAPYGLSREITSISQDGRTVETTTATLEKIIKNGSISFKGTVSSSNVQSSSSVREGVSLTTAQQAQEEFGISLNNVVLYDADGDLNTTSDQVLANGRIEVGMDFDFDADVSFLKLNSLEFTNTSTVNADVTVGSNILGIASNIEIPLGEYYFAPIIVPSPFAGLPIVAVPKVGFYVGMNPTNVNPLSVRVTQESTLETALRYQGGFNASVDFSSNFDFTNPVLSGQWDLNVYATPRLTLLFGGFLGASAGIRGNLKLEASDANNWQLYGGLAADLGISMEIFTKGISAYFKEVLNYEQLLAESEPLPLGITDTLFAEQGANIKWSSLSGGSGYSAADSLRASRDEGFSEYHSLIQFPLNLPGATIDSAKLRLSGLCASNFTDPFVFVRSDKITTPWDATTVTWDTRPGYSTVTGSNIPNDGQERWNEWDVTSLVQDWANGNPNYGIVLIASTNESRCVFKGNGYSDSNLRPSLVVSY